MGREPSTLQDSKYFCAETRERRSLGQDPGITPSPCSPGLGAAATVAQQEGPGVTPKTQGLWGV